jgi:hypothetical protein
LCDGEDRDSFTYSERGDQRRKEYGRAAEAGYCRERGGGEGNESEEDGVRGHGITVARGEREIG